jgi:hypothetical protein
MHIKSIFFYFKFGFRDKNLVTPSTAKRRKTKIKVPINITSQQLSEIALQVMAVDCPLLNNFLFNLLL